MKEIAEICKFEEMLSLTQLNYPILRDWVIRLRAFIDFCEVLLLQVLWLRPAFDSFPAFVPPAVLIVHGPQ